MSESKNSIEFRYLSFALYSEVLGDGLTLDEVIELASSGELIALGEGSGSESAYIEIARWSRARKRHERFAFCKMLDVEVIDSEGNSLELDCREKCKLVLERIGAGNSGLIHHLPNWEEPVKEKIS